MNPCDSQQDCKINLCRSQEQVGWGDLTIQQMFVYDLPHHSMAMELFDEVKAVSHL